MDVPYFHMYIFVTIGTRVLEYSGSGGLPPPIPMKVMKLYFICRYFKQSVGKRMLKSLFDRKHRLENWLKSLKLRKKESR